MKVTLSGKSFFVNVIKDLEIRAYWIIQRALNPKTSPFKTQKRKRHREKKQKTGDNRHIDWSDAFTSQGMPEATRSWKKKGRIPP